MLQKMQTKWVGSNHRFFAMKEKGDGSLYWGSYHLHGQRPVIRRRKRRRKEEDKGKQKENVAPFPSMFPPLIHSAKCICCLSLFKPYSFPYVISRHSISLGYIYRLIYCSALPSTLFLIVWQNLNFELYYLVLGLENWPIYVPVIISLNGYVFYYRASISSEALQKLCKNSMKTNFIY